MDVGLEDSNNQKQAGLTMKIVVVGLGSMGKRRIRLINEIDKDIEIYGVDSNTERCKAALEEFGIETYGDLNKAIDEEKPDSVFVCTSPLSHRAIIECLLDKDVYVFTELNLVRDGYERFKNEDKLFLSSTFLYRDDIKWIINKISGERVNYIYHTGQYLPDWHPWEDYRKYFVGDNKSNGCREIMAIEFPWLIRAFGEIEDVHTLADKMSELEISYNDNYMLSVLHQNGTRGLIAVDVVSRNATRSLEVYNENLHVKWDGRPDSLVDFDLDKKEFENIRVYENVQHREGYSSNIIENAYKAEIEAFFEYATGSKAAALYDFKKDDMVLKLIDMIENVE